MSDELIRQSLGRDGVLGDSRPANGMGRVRPTKHTAALLLFVSWWSSKEAPEAETSGYQAEPRRVIRIDATNARAGSPEGPSKRLSASLLVKVWLWKCMVLCQVEGV